MDALTEALAGVRFRGVMNLQVELMGAWGLRVANKGGAPFYVVLEGGGWLVLEGQRPLRLVSGDFILLPHDPPHVLCDALESPTEEVLALLENHPPDSDGVWRWGSGGPITTAIGGCFFFEEAQTSPLLAALPAVLHIPGEAGRVALWLEQTLQFLVAEARRQRPGAEAVVMRLADVLFIQAVRAHIEALSEGERSWLGALNDPEIARALTLVHTKPELPWKVETLARQVALSRAAFASRFSERVGEPPLRYLTRWRVHRAAILLGEGQSATEVAPQVGYQSVAAFCRVFRQETGMSPIQYRLWKRHKK